jgi:hypothetical protein
MTVEATDAADFGKNARPAVDLIKDVLNILRDLLLMVLFLGLIFSQQFRSFLASRGANEFDLGFVKVNTQAAAQETSSASASVQKAIETLNTLATASKDPAAKETVAKAVSQLSGSLTTLDSANSRLAAAVTATVAAKSGEGAAPGAPSSSSQGWIYIGEADASKSRWKNPPQPKVNSDSPVFKSGDRITLNDDIFAHAEKGPNQTFNQAAILTAVSANSTLTVVDEQFSSALNGGNFVWVKVQLPR